MANKKGAAFFHAEPWGYHTPKQHIGKHALKARPSHGVLFRRMGNVVISGSTSLAKANEEFLR